MEIPNNVRSQNVKNFEPIFINILLDICITKNISIIFVIRKRFPIVELIKMIPLMHDLQYTKILLLPSKCEIIFVTL